MAGAHSPQRPEYAMAKSKRTPTLTSAGVLDWTGRVEYEPAAIIFAQGNPATSVMYVEMGAVRLSVLSHAGKEAVVGARCRPFLRRGLSCGPDAADGNGDGDGREHNLGR